MAQTTFTFDLERDKLTDILLRFQRTLREAIDDPEMGIRFNDQDVLTKVYLGLEILSDVTHLARM